MTLLALYLGCLVLGGILVGASMLGGHDEGAHDADHGAADHDHDGDLGDADVGAGADHHHDHHLPDPASADPGLLVVLRSVRFWTFFLAAFGLAGSLLTATGAPSLISLPLALGTGAMAGTIVSWILRRLAQDTVTTETSTRQLAGKEAEVVLAIGPGKRGKIRVSHNGTILDLPAITGDEALLDRGTTVLIVEVSHGSASVTQAEPKRPATPQATSR